MKLPEKISVSVKDVPEVIKQFEIANKEIERLNKELESLEKLNNANYQSFIKANNIINELENELYKFYAYEGYNDEQIKDKIKELKGDGSNGTEKL